MTGVRVVLVWVPVAVLVAWAVLRATGLTLAHPFPILLAFTPYVAAASLLLLGALLGARQWSAAAVTAVAVVVLAACVLPRGFGTSRDTGGPTLTVMSMNMWAGAADAAQIVDLVRIHQVDVLALQESTPRAEANLAAAGLAEELPFAEAHPSDYASGSSVYSRFPLRDGALLANPGNFLQASAVVQKPGAPAVRVTSVHPVPPNPAFWVPLWAAALRAEPPAPRPPDLAVLAGDFNATLDHAQLRAVLSTGYTDAAASVGAGLTPTWPYAGERQPITPKVTIDHILTSKGIGTRDFTAARVASTDHRAIIATLLLPAPPSR